MRKVSDVGRWPLRSKVRGTCLLRTIRLKISQTTFALFAVGLATSAAKADVWVVTYKVAGNNVYNGSPYGGESWASCFAIDPQTGETLGNHWYGDDTMPLGVHFEDRHSGVPVDSSGHYGGLSSHIDGTVVVVLTREDGDGHEVMTNIPATASIKVHGYSHGTYSGTDGGSTITLDIGKAVPPTLDSNVSSDPDNNAATPDVYQHDKVLDSVYLLTKNVPAGQNKVVFEGIPLQSKIESHAGNGSTGTGGGSHHLGAFIEVVSDDRSVKLSRNGQDRFVLENGNWVTHGDTTYSYNEEMEGQSPPDDFGVSHSYKFQKHQVNTQEVRANFSGQWTQTVHVAQEGPHAGENYYGVGYRNQWSPSDPGDISYYLDDANHTFQHVHSQDMPDGSQLKQLNGLWKGRASGAGEKIINFSVKDPSDDAEATAEYILHLHDEWENIHKIGDGVNFSSFESWQTNLSPGGLGVLSTPNNFVVTRTPITREIDLGVASLNVLVGGVGNGLSNIPVLGWFGSSLLAEIYGQSGLNEPSPVPSETYYCDSATISPLWSKALESYNPTAECHTTEQSPVEPDFIQGIYPEQTPVVRQAIEQGTAEQKAELWVNARIVGIGMRHYFYRWNMQAEHYNAAGKTGEPTFVIPREFKNEKVGLFQTQPANGQVNPGGDGQARTLNSTSASSPTAPATNTTSPSGGNS